MLDAKRPPGRRVVVYDCDGYFTAPAMAELLAGEGLDVEFVTCHDQVAPFCAETLEDVLTRERLHSLGVGMRRATVVTAVSPGSIDARDEFGDPIRIAADGVVLVTQRISDDRLWRALPDIPRVYRIGDCVAPRLIADAIFDGHRLARELETEDPQRLCRTSESDPARSCRAQLSRALSRWLRQRRPYAAVPRGC